MDRWVGRVALVTGASSGIGAALVKALVKAGMKVVGCARSVDRIQALATELKGAKGCLKAVKCDVTKEEDILSMFNTIKSDPKYGGVDVCINNAGLCHTEPLLSGKSDKWRNMMEVNVLGPSIVTREAYKSMQERKVDDGHIFILNSVAGHVVLDMAPVHFYTATKFAVTALLEGLRQELREAKTGIRVTGVSPGYVETEFAQRSMPDNPDMNKQAYGQFPCLQAEDIANTIVFALQSPPHVQVHDLIIRPTKQPL